MHLLVERDALATALGAVNARSCGKTKIPILGCVLLEAADSRLRIFSHWLDACCSFEIPAEITISGSIAVGAEKLFGLVGGFVSGAQVSIHVDGQMLELKAGRARYKLPIFPAADFPLPLTGEDAVKFSVSATDFKSLIDIPKIAMSDQPSRRSLNGVYLHTTAIGLASCATDGFNLVLVQTARKVPHFDPIIIPRERVADLLTGVEKGDVEIECCPRLFSITIGKRRYTTKLIDGNFPDYPRVIPAPSVHEIVITRSDLVAALARLLIALGDHNAIMLSWGAGASTLVVAPQMGDGAEELLESAGGEIPPGEFVTSASRLAQLMSVMPYDEVKLTFTSTTQPLRIEGMKDESVLQLVMPLDFGRPAAAAAA
jgi:DNA polymerase-3 subunit beta